MSRSSAVAAGGRRVDRLARVAERLLRVTADLRLALLLLLLAGAWNAAAAALTGGSGLLASPPYLILLVVILCTGAAGVAVRWPAAWREWRRPFPIPETAEVLVAELATEGPVDQAARTVAAATLRQAGYRVAAHGTDARWSLAGTRRGWSRLVGQLSHLALVLMLLGAAGGRAFASETTFSLLPGQQALLDAPRPGFTAAVRLDRFDAEFGADGRPLRLDATVTFLRDGEAATTQLIQVNRPGAYDGFLVHGWTYGPAARVRVTTLGGQPLLDGPVALDRILGGRPAAIAELPSAGLTLGLSLLDAHANLLGATASNGGGQIDAVRLRPGEEARLGLVLVRLVGFEAYLTFLSRRDPGMGLLFGGATLLVACLAVALWLPRRRLTLRGVDGKLRLVLRGERFDLPAAELEALRKRLAAALGPRRA